MTTERTEHEQAAYARGVTDAKSAASWAVDGNTSADHIRRVLAMLEDGDPQADDYLPRRPDLSGEYADDLTPVSLYEDITGEDHAAAEDAAGLAYETLVGSVVDQLADAYEDGVSDTFAVECERVLRAALPDDDD